MPILNSNKDIKEHHKDLINYELKTLQPLVIIEYEDKQEENLLLDLNTDFNIEKLGFDM